MGKVIIGIHGLANKPQQSVLETWWRDSLVEGLKHLGVEAPAFDFELVYWAAGLYKNPQHTDPLYNFDSLYNTQPYLPAMDGALQSYEESWLDEIREGFGSLAGKVGDFRRELQGESHVLSELLDSKLKDLAFYYDPSRQIDDGSGQPDIARQVLDARLATQLRAHAGKEILLIAHSMGTIIAYNVLRDLGQLLAPMQVARFVTIGSPLGLPHVKYRIIEERQYDPKVRCPSIVTDRWVNYADRKDPVAVDTHLGDDYGPNATGVSVKDDLVSNDYAAPSGDRNHHKSYGYLRTPELAKEVKDFLGV